MNSSLPKKKNKLKKSEEIALKIQGNIEKKTFDSWRSHLLTTGSIPNYLPLHH